MTFEYRDHDGDSLHVAPLGTPDEALVGLAIETRAAINAVHIPLARVEEVVAGIRDAARQATGQDDTRPDPTTADDPTPLRWGLGDDDTVTVCLSGPDRAPYWLELDRERAAALRDDLARPDRQHTTKEQLASVLSAHIGNGANAEDCPGCAGTNPPYPFICPGPKDA